MSDIIFTAETTTEKTLFNTESYVPQHDHLICNTDAPVEEVVVVHGCGRISWPALALKVWKKLIICNLCANAFDGNFGNVLGGWVGGDCKTWMKERLSLVVKVGKRGGEILNTWFDLDFVFHLIFLIWWSPCVQGWEERGWKERGKGPRPLEKSSLITLRMMLLIRSRR